MRGFTQNRQIGINLPLAVMNGIRRQNGGSWVCVLVGDPPDGFRPGESPTLVLPGGSGDVGGDDVGGVPVERGASAVVAHGGPRISVGGGFLHVTQRYPGVQGSGDKCVPQRVRPDALDDRGPASHAADDPPGAVPVEPAPVSGDEDRTFDALADGQVNRPRGPRCQRDRDDLAALAGDHQGPVAPLDTQGLDVGAGGLGYPQPVQGQQRDQRVLGRRAEPGCHQQRAELVTIQADSVRLIVQPRAAHMGCGRVIEKFFLDRVAVEPGHCAQPPRDGRAGAAAGFEVAGEALDVRAAGGEQVQLVLLAPGRVLAQDQLVGLAGQAAIPGQEPG
jgi:hypothetical protein